MPSSENSISIHDDISIARTMPSKFYLEDYYFDRLLDILFKNSWQFIIHKNCLSKNLYPFFFFRGYHKRTFTFITEK